MTETTTQCSAEAHVYEDFDTGEKIITLRIFRNLGVEVYYVLDSLDVYENTRSNTKWEAREKEND